MVHQKCNDVPDTFAGSNHNITSLLYGKRSMDYG